FPKERNEIKSYVNKLKELADKYPLYNLKYDKMPEELNFDYLDESILSYFNQNFSNSKLRSVLGGTNLLYAGEPEISTFYEHGLIMNSYIESSYRFINGSGQIANALVRNIRRMGGTVLRYKKVSKIVCDDKSNAQYVELDNGERFYADNFISNIHPTTTMNLVDGVKIRKSYTNRLNAIPNSSSAFALHIAFKKDSFPFFNHNAYHFKDGAVWDTMNYTDAEWPKSYLALTPPSSQNDEFADGMIVIAYMHYDEVAKWGDVENTVGFEESRGADYEEFKIKKSEKLIDEIAKKYPGIRNHIESYCSSTPLTYKDYLHTPEGSIYGYMKDFQNPLKAYISPMTKVRNLYFTGQNVNMHGVMGVTVSSIITCGALLGTNYLLGKVLESK
ncbi:MAG: phytoene desaturase family protein, partial [Chitinophagales bacterium]